MVERLAGGSADPALRFARCLVLCMRVYVQCRGAAWTKHLSCPQSAPDDAWWGMAAVELRRLEWVKSFISDKIERSLTCRFIEK